MFSFCPYSYRACNTVVNMSIAWGVSDPFKEEGIRKYGRFEFVQGHGKTP